MKWNKPHAVRSLWSAFTGVVYEWKLTRERSVCGPWTSLRAKLHFDHIDLICFLKLLEHVKTFVNMLKDKLFTFVCMNTNYIRTHTRTCGMHAYGKWVVPVIAQQVRCDFIKCSIKKWFNSWLVLVCLFRLDWMQAACAHVNFRPGQLIRLNVCELTRM